MRSVALPDESLGLSMLLVCQLRLIAAKVFLRAGFSPGVSPATYRVRDTGADSHRSTA